MLKARCRFVEETQRQPRQVFAQSSVSGVRAVTVLARVVWSAAEKPLLRLRHAEFSSFLRRRGAHRTRATPPKSTAPTKQPAPNISNAVICLSFVMVTYCRQRRVYAVYATLRCTTTPPPRLNRLPCMDDVPPSTQTTFARRPPATFTRQNGGRTALLSCSRLFFFTTPFMLLRVRDTVVKGMNESGIAGVSN